MTTSTSPPVLVLLSAMSAFAANTVTLFFYLGAGLLFGAPLHPNLAASTAVFALSVIIAVAMGLIAAALQLAIQKGSAVVWALGSVWFLTGTMFPVQTLPKVLRGLAQLIPITHSLEGMRLALLEGASLTRVGYELVVLSGFAAVLIPVSLLAFSWTLRRARMQGTLSFY
jgi:ABC-2 type transport system permease protein